MEIKNKKLIILENCSATKIGLLKLIKSIYKGEIISVTNFYELEQFAVKNNITHVIIDLDNAKVPYINNTIFKNIKIAGYSSTQINKNKYIDILRKQDELINHTLFFKRFFSDTSNEKIDEENYLDIEINPFVTLTPKQKEIIKLVALGYKTLEIANLLNLKSNTISTVKNTCFKKLKVSNISELILLADKHMIHK